MNIPTEELRNFVREDELRPETILYRRDPSLDPQLVWKGKDEQDAEDRAVPIVPVYIQETVHPQALVENVRDTSKVGGARTKAAITRLLQNSESSPRPGCEEDVMPRFCLDEAPCNPHKPNQSARQSTCNRCAPPPRIDFEVVGDADEPGLRLRTLSAMKPEPAQTHIGLDVPKYRLHRLLPERI